MVLLGQGGGREGGSGGRQGGGVGGGDGVRRWKEYWGLELAVPHPERSSPGVPVLS